MIREFRSEKDKGERKVWVCTVSLVFFYNFLFCQYWSKPTVCLSTVQLPFCLRVLIVCLPLCHLFWLGERKKKRNLLSISLRHCRRDLQAGSRALNLTWKGHRFVSVSTSHLAWKSLVYQFSINYWRGKKKYKLPKKLCVADRESQLKEGWHKTSSLGWFVNQFKLTGMVIVSFQSTVYAKISIISNRHAVIDLNTQCWSGIFIQSQKEN